MATYEEYDSVIIGSGFGGIGAALSLAERGAKVTLLETLKYPGGCAGTFSRQGYRFEAGATLSSGFGSGQLFKRWIDRYRLDIELEWLSPVIHFRSEGLALDIPSDIKHLVDQLCDLPDAPEEGIRAFFSHQQSVAEPLWQLFDDPNLLPPWTLSSLWSHLKKIPQYRPMIRDMNHSLAQVMQRYHVDTFKPLKLYLDSLCQITLQCGSQVAEAPFALSTMDYYGRGTAHVIGGLGKLAQELCRALERAGGELSLSNRVKGIEPVQGGGYLVHTRRGTLKTRTVVSNLLPEGTQQLLPSKFRWPKWVDRTQREVDKGWGAAMFYLVAERPKNSSGGAEHWQLVGDDQLPLIEGNHVFCSTSSQRELDRAPTGSHTLTLSTHIPMSTLRALPKDEKPAYINRVQSRMRQTFAERCPEWSEQVYFGLSASPRTFERFTGRKEGLVGGIPRRRGWHNYIRLGPRSVAEGLYLVGDSSFPGQSTLATAVGGERLATLMTKRELSHLKNQRGTLSLPCSDEVSFNDALKPVIKKVGQ